MARVLRLESAPDGGSRASWLDLPMEREESDAAGLRRAALEAATSVRFVEAPADWDYRWHNAPRRQYVLLLQGSVEIETSDGSVYALEPGAIVLAEDTEGEGHITRSVGETPVTLGIVPLEPT